MGKPDDVGATSQFKSLRPARWVHPGTVDEFKLQLGELRKRRHRSLLLEKQQWRVSLMQLGRYGARDRSIGKTRSGFFSRKHRR